MSVSLYDHEQRIKNIDTKIVEITNKITELENKGSGVEIVSVTNNPISGYKSNSLTFTLDPKYNAWDYEIIGIDGNLSGFNEYKKKLVKLTMRKDYIRLSTVAYQDSSGNRPSWTISRNANTLTMTANYFANEWERSSRLTLNILFYKKK